MELVLIVAPASLTKPLAAAAVTVMPAEACSANQYLPAGRLCEHATVTNPSEVVATGPRSNRAVVGLPSLSMS